MESPKKTNHLSEPETDPRSGPPSPTWSHPVPHTRSNHLHRGNPPLRPRPPPSPPATRPYALLTRLNSARDFDESLASDPGSLLTRSIGGNSLRRVLRHRRCFLAFRPRSTPAPHRTRVPHKRETQG